MDVGTGKDSRIDSHSGGLAGHWTEGQHPRSAASAFAEDIVEQYLTLGLSRTEASRLLQLGCTALDSVLAEIDIHAFTAVSVADQVSMLLPRLDVDSLAEMMGMTTAQLQSAMAMLTLEYVMRLQLG